MTWARVRGHEQIIQSFNAAWRQGRLGHAYLFVGPAGVGKHTLARELARAILCEAKPDGLAACGHCKGCNLVDAGTHPDLFLASRPEELNDIPIELIRDLIGDLALKPARGARKIAILDDADDMSAPAANAFLKTLEEPSPGSLLILIGGPSPDRQFATILRCQVVPFSPLPVSTVSAFLLEKGVNDSSSRDRLARVSGGSLGRALALNDDALWQFRSALLRSIDTDVIEAYALATSWNAQIDESGKESGMRRRRASLGITLLIGMLQDAQRILLGVAPTVAVGEEVAILERVARRLGPEKLAAWIDRAIETDLQVDRRVQLDLAVESLTDALAR